VADTFLPTVRQPRAEGHAKQSRRDNKPRLVRKLRPGPRTHHDEKLHLVKKHLVKKLRPGLIATSKATLKPRTFTTTANGLDTTLDETTQATTSIVPSSMAASPVASAAPMSGALAEADPTAFGLTASTSVWLRLIWPTPMTGIGRATKS
jgi:hypothetical protein